MDFVSGKKITIGEDKNKGWMVRVGSTVVHCTRTEELAKKWVEDQKELEMVISKFFSLPTPGTNPLKLVYSAQKKAG